jgi:hypothetical protein
VDGILRGQVDSRDQAIVPPETLGERIETRARERRLAARPRFEDYAIAFAAAVRALEAGHPSVAREGFSLVARGAPDSELGRDAEYYERLAQFRVRERQGEDREVLLTEFQARADAAWDRAMERKDPLACRNALAWERVRITLIEEIRPGADLAEFRERVDLLRGCS